MTTSERQLEEDLISKLKELKYSHREDIRDRATLEANFREKFQQLNRVKLTDEEFLRLLEEIVTPDVFTAAQTLRSRNSFTREDGTPLNYTLVNIEDWCKNTFEVVNEFSKKAYRHFLGNGAGAAYVLRDTGNTPFFHHVASLRELCEAADSGELRTYHFNVMRAIMEKTASFHGYGTFADCIRPDEDDDPDKTLYARVVNIMSHGNYSLYEPVDMMDENKAIFRKVLNDFRKHFPFNPALFEDPNNEAPAA